MAKAQHGNFAAYTTPGGIRYMKDSKLTSANSVPLEVQALLTQQLTGERGQVVEPTPAPAPAPKFPRPTPEQLAQLRAESLQVPPELQRTPEEMAAATPSPAEAPLTSDDFPVVEPAPDEDPINNPYQPVPSQVPEVTTTSETFPETDARPVPELSPQEIDTDFLVSVSIHSASLDDMVQALYNRFGIYTVFLRKLPEADEINPLTAENFTKYHLGIAYQASIYAQNKGLLDIAPESNRKMIDQGREAAQNWSVDPRPKTVGEARRMNTFDVRTSPQGLREEPRTEIRHVVGEDGITRAERIEIPEGETGQYNGARARYDEDEDQPIVEPGIGRQVIRPNW